VFVDFNAHVESRSDHPKGAKSAGRGSVRRKGVYFPACGGQNGNPGEPALALGLDEEQTLLKLRSAAFVLLVAVSPAMGWSQAPIPDPSQPAGQAQPPGASQSDVPAAQKPANGTPAAPDALPAQQQKKQEKQQKKERPQPRQTKRMLWVVPNFAAVDANTKVPPLTPRGKFVLAWHDSFDYSSFAWTAITAGQSFALNSDPELHQGIAGYGRYYWRAFVDGVSGTYFTEAIIPVISHEDPRYYTLGHGGFFHRMGYALSRVVLTKTDSGGTSFNWSEVGGNLLEASLSNAYYPPQERGVHQTLNNWGVQIESAALNNIAKEFWPDFRSKVLRQK
jgi:hypothetical protein